MTLPLKNNLIHQLRESQAYNRGLIEASVDGLITVDSEGTISDVNEQMSRMSGYSREELIGMPFCDYFVDRERATAGVNETFLKSFVTDYVLTLATRDAQQLQVSFNASVFRDSAGDIRGIFASARDITEQAQLQTQLHEQQAYNRGLIEASVDGLVTVDESMTITDVNETMCQMAGRPRSQLVGSAFPTYFTDPEHAREGVRLTYQEGSVTNYVLTLQGVGDRQLPVSFNAAIFKDTAGNVRGIFASARNITEQKQLEGQLRDSQFYSRTLIESNIDALMTTDPLGILTDVNPQMEALTGYSRDELLGTAFKIYFTNPQQAESGIRQVLREGRVTNYELTARSKTRLDTVVSYNATTFNDADGKLQGVFAAARDITEQKQLEKQLVQALEKCQLTAELAPSPSYSAHASFLNREKPGTELAPLDPKVLQEFRATAGENASAFLAELIDCYFEETPKQLQAMKAAASQGDVNALRWEAHTLKSSSAALGATTFANISKELEVISFTGAIEALEKVLQLEAEYERVKVALQIERQQCQI